MKRWRVHTRFRRYSQHEVVAESHTVEYFWFRWNAERRANRACHQPLVVSWVERVR